MSAASAASLPAVFAPAIRVAARVARPLKIVMVTAYDAPSARVAEAGGADWLLVGDSAATVILGHASTRLADISLMRLCTSAVRRAAPKKPVVTDLPYPAVRLSDAALTADARSLIKAGADAVKIEWTSKAAAQTAALIKAGIPVMGHVGLTPQDLRPGAAYKVRGTDPAAARRILDAARTFQSLGAFAVVFECVPETLARRAAEELDIPVIGIGAGRFTDGQVLVFHDLVGLTPDFGARFVKRFADSWKVQTGAVRRYASEVRKNTFPSRKHVYGNGSGK
jgi:3-methyl-2-oxobutanoate hydroxymethyltransferase